VVLDAKIYVYNFQNLKLVEVIETCSNLKGICAVSPSKEVCVLAAPEKKVGTVRIVHFDKGSKTQLVDAHQSAIAAIALNNEGTILATASDKVTDISNFT
jgi:WD40 repeat protein